MEGWGERTPGAAVPVLQVGHGEVPADEAHLQADDLPVFGGRGAAVFGRAGVVAATVAWRLRADAIPRQVGHQRRLLEERRHLTDVLHCGETETSAAESVRVKVWILVQIHTGKSKSTDSLRILKGSKGCWFCLFEMLNWCRAETKKLPKRFQILHPQPLLKQN